MSRTKRCARTLLALAVGLALLAGCRTQTVVDVAVRPDGSGRVAVLVFLDADAAAKAGDLGKVLRVGDLEARAWKVVGPAPTAQVLSTPGLDKVFSGGGAAAVPAGVEVVALTHEFANVAQANALLAGLSGARGPLRDVTVSRSSSFASTKITVHGTLDFSRGLDSLSDPALTSALKGRTLTQVAAELNGGTAPAPGDVGLTLRVHGEGVGLHAAAAPAAVHPGDPARAVSYSGSQQHTAALLWAGLAILLLLAALAAFVVPRLPGRAPPPPPARKRQLRSADDGWELVEKRTGTSAPPVPKPGKGRHSRPRGQPPSWRS